MTVKDFVELLRRKGVNAGGQLVLRRMRSEIVAPAHPNWRAEHAVFKISR